jgi:hypothetical protein
MNLSAVEKILPKKRQYLGMEILVESNTIKARSVGTDSGKILASLSLRVNTVPRTRQGRTCCEMKIRFRGQPIPDPKTAAS